MHSKIKLRSCCKNAAKYVVTFPMGERPLAVCKTCITTDLISGFEKIYDRIKGNEISPENLKLKRGTSPSFTGSQLPINHQERLND